ncbi:MAG: hypothetical protein HYZ17_11680 [Betaproteobacteria bacterium]|nr:hypothetical protein [Betaproteobacteria bacterium]
MWPFFQRQPGNQEGAQDNRRRPMKFTELLDGIGDFSDLQCHDRALKFWLPEPAFAALEELCSRNALSISETLRQFFAVHCYGAYTCELMVQAIPGLFKDWEDASAFQPIREYERGRPATYWVPELGKNVASVKVWVPKRMATELTTLAEHVGVKRSQYLREIVISRLLGHGTLPMRPRMLSAEVLATTEAWCDGEDDTALPMRQVSEEEYSDANLGEIRWVDGQAAEGRERRHQKTIER